MRGTVLLLSALLGCIQCVLAEELSVFTEFSPPYHYQNANNDVVGVGAERVQAIVEEAGMSANIQLYPWARSLYLVYHTPSSLIFSIARTPEREPLFQWIAPVVKFKLALVTLRANDISLLGGWEELANYRFAVQRGDIAKNWLESHGLVEGKQLFICPDIGCSWSYLNKGEIDFIVEDPSLIASTSETLGIPKDKVKTLNYIPELEVLGYLAANRTMPEEMVVRLQNAAERLGFNN